MIANETNEKVTTPTSVAELPQECTATKRSIKKVVEEVIRRVEEECVPIDTTTSSLVTSTTSTSTGSTANIYNKEYLEQQGCLQFVKGSTIGFGSTFEIEYLLEKTGDTNQKVTRNPKTDGKVETIEWQGWLFVAIHFKTPDFNLKKGARRKRLSGTPEHWFDNIKKHLDACKDKNKVIFFSYQSQQSENAYWTHWRNGGKHYMNYRGRFAAMLLMHLRNAAYDNKMDYMMEPILREHMIWFYFLPLLEEDDGKQDDGKQDESNEVMEVVSDDLLIDFLGHDPCDGCASNEENQLGHTCNLKEIEDDLEYGQNEEIVADNMVNMVQVKAATSIQRVFRGYWSRKPATAATTIQRLFRAYRIRKTLSVLHTEDYIASYTKYSITYDIYIMGDMEPDIYSNTKKVNTYQSVRTIQKFWRRCRRMGYNGSLSSGNSNNSKDDDNGDDNLDNNGGSNNQGLATWVAIDSRRQVLDPDGFKRDDTDMWEKEYTYSEYMRRRAGCTTRPKTPAEIKLSHKKRVNMNIKKYSFTPQAGCESNEMNQEGHTCNQKAMDEAMDEEPPSRKRKHDDDESEPNKKACVEEVSIDLFKDNGRIDSDIKVYAMCKGLPYLLQIMKIGNQYKVFQEQHGITADGVTKYLPLSKTPRKRTMKAVKSCLEKFTNPMPQPHVFPEKTELKKFTSV